MVESVTPKGFSPATKVMPDVAENWNGMFDKFEARTSQILLPSHGNHHNLKPILGNVKWKANIDPSMGNYLTRTASCPKSDECGTKPDAFFIMSEMKKWDLV